MPLIKFKFNQNRKKLKKIGRVLICGFLFLSTLACQVEKKNDQNDFKVLLEKVPAPFQAPEELFEVKSVVALKKPDDFLKVINKIIDHELGYFVFDKSTSRIMLFDHQGSFIREYGKLGEGPGEFGSIYDFFIINDLVYVFSPANLALFSYQIGTGEFVEQSPLMVFAQRIVPISDDEILVYVSNNPSDTNFNVYRFDLNGNKLQEYFPFDPVRSFAIVGYTGFLISNDSGEIFYCDPYGYQVFKFNKETRDFDIAFEFGFVSEEIKNDRENFERYTGSYQLDPSNQVRFAGSLFRKNRNFIITDMTYDAKLQSAIINLSNNEVKVLSKRVDSQFIKFLKPPAIFNEDNELVYLYDPETFQDFPSDSSSPIFNAINEYAEKFSEDDIYYLLVLKLKM